MIPIFFHYEAEAEMTSAAVYYEAQQPGLGKRFLIQVDNAVRRIQVNPLLCRIIESDVRRCLVKIFPYGVLYRLKPSRIEVIAVMHLHREPGYWRRR